MTCQINIFGGPGIGKSTTATGLFNRMKKKGYVVEYHPEFAKTLVYSKDYTRLQDQLLLLAIQHHPQRVMNNQVDFLIHDSPFIMGLTYLIEDHHLPVLEFTQLSIAMYKTYNNINIFLNRDPARTKYQEHGRYQTWEQALEKDQEIKNLLDTNDIKYHEISISKKINKKILKLIKSIKKERIYNGTYTRV